MNAPSIAKWILIATPLMFAGCRTSSSVAPIGGTVGPDGGGNGALLVQDQGNYDAPPHLFSPRPHPPHTRSDPAPANIAALPKLVNRIDRCYGSERAEIAGHAPPPTPRPVKPRGNGGYVGKYKKVPYGATTPSAPPPPTGGLIAQGGGSTGQGRAEKKPASPPKAKASTASPRDASGGDRYSPSPSPASAPAAGAPMPDMAPTASSQPVASKAAEPSRADRRAERKAER
jgi:hypothetical protein